MNPSRSILSVLMLCLGASITLARSAETSTLTNSLGTTLVRIQPGSFEMGSPDGDFDEQPVHSVRITRPFFMAATEISNAQYEQFDPAHRHWRGAMGFSKEDDEAVIFVSWHDAVRFCQWLSAKEGRNYRLPTEAEWEYACRAGTTTPYHTGAILPDSFHKHPKQEWIPIPTSLKVGRTPANSWGLQDLHGNVEEWCADWYGPYSSTAQSDPVGPGHGDFKVTRGGSHNTLLQFLRSANRAGTVPEDKHWLIGFRVVLADPLPWKPQPPAPPERWAREVPQNRHDWPPQTDSNRPYFRGPREYVKIPPNSDGPMFSRHNHQPAITGCPNGDLLAIWYTCRNEDGRELAVVASRLRRGQDEWEAAAPFWDAPDRNDHGNALWWDARSTLYHFNGLGTDGTWGKLALVLRTSTDNGATWSPARLINPKHGLRHQVIAGPFQTATGAIVLACDAVTGGHGGTAVHISQDGGQTWVDPGADQPAPKFAEGTSGAWIAGIHAGVAELKDGRLLALGRGDSINGQMPRSISSDGGRAWTYSASGLPPLGSGQRLVLLRLKEGPLFLASFAREMTLTNAAGQPVRVSGLFGALSYDEGETWPVRRLITDDGPARELDGGGNTRKFVLGPTTAEPRGYMAGTQTPDGIIQLISSKQHYAFNVAWLKAPMPTTPPAEPTATPAPASTATPAPNQKPNSEPPATDKPALEQKFKETLTKSIFEGRWCLIQDGKLTDERNEKYTIQSANKVGEDSWIIFARIQYGNKDVLVPVPVEVKWAGDTPVISITNLAIPGLGTYTARVVVYDRTYAGTWSGGKNAGMLHGLIKPGE